MRVRFVREGTMNGCWGLVTKNGVSSLFVRRQSKWMRVMRGRGAVCAGREGRMIQVLLHHSVEPFGRF